MWVACCVVCALWKIIIIRNKFFLCVFVRTIEWMDGWLFRLSFNVPSFVERWNRYHCAKVNKNKCDLIFSRSRKCGLLKKKKPTQLKRTKTQKPLWWLTFFFIDFIISIEKNENICSHLRVSWNIAYSMQLGKNEKIVYGSSITFTLCTLNLKVDLRNFFLIRSRSSGKDMFISPFKLVQFRF